VSGKKVVFGTKPSAPSAAAEKWIGEREVPLPAVPMKRLTIDVTEDLHRRIKMICAAHGLKMADELRRILEERFPEK
jgi:hypothetical protein